VGATGYVSSDVRVVAATNRDLSAEVRAGRFREDLYHRLGVVRVTLLPLRERRDDIPRLVQLFLARAAGRREPPTVTEDTLALLKGHEWPGNVRELRNVLERALSLSPSARVLDAHTFGLDEPSYRADVSGPPIDLSSPFKEAKERLIQAWEREYVSALLDRAGGNVSLAARTSGLDRVYLHRLMKKHGLAS
jgi:DNA-binding NtrC family response regulator